MTDTPETARLAGFPATLPDAPAEVRPANDVQMLDDIIDHLRSLSPEDRKALDEAMASVQAGAR